MYITAVRVIQNTGATMSTAPCLCEVLGHGFHCPCHLMNCWRSSWVIHHLKVNLSTVHVNSGWIGTRIETSCAVCGPFLIKDIWANVHHLERIPNFADGLKNRTCVPAGSKINLQLTNNAPRLLSRTPVLWLRLKDIEVKALPLQWFRYLSSVVCNITALPGCGIISSLRYCNYIYALLTALRSWWHFKAGWGDTKCDINHCRWLS